MSDEKKNSILIVDDERVNLDILNKILNSEYTIYITKSGASAIKITNELSPDLILLDILMPDMDGYEVLEALKASGNTKHTPVIFITGLESAEDEEKGRALQVVDYIHKPLDPDIVRQKVADQMRIINQARKEN